MWFWGVGVAIIPIVYGVICLFRGHTSIIERGWKMATFNGAEAVGLALGYIFIGAFLHFRYFWGLKEQLSEWSQILSVLSIFGFIASCVYIFYRILFC